MGIQTIRQVGSIPFCSANIDLVISLLRKKRGCAHEKK